MRNFILAVLFGLFLSPAVTMAAPPQHLSSCKITMSSSSFITTNCTVAERKLVAAAQNKPTAKQVDTGLDRLAGKEYLTINTICNIKGGRRKAARRLVERCYRRAGEGQRLILGNAFDNLQDIKACKGVKGLGKQVNCMINQDNNILLPLIERTLDAHEAYMKGLKFMIDMGCSFKGGKLKCASSAGLIALILFYALMGWVGRVKSVLIIVAAAAGCLAASVAEGACTAEQLAFNYVGAQYGVVYPCGEQVKKPAPKKAEKLDVKASIRAYFESIHHTIRVDENPGRLDRITTAFEAVYGDEPMEVQKLALAICLKETGCGFSEALSYKIRGGKVKKSHRIYTREVYMSKAQACGVVQVATHGLKGECARLNSSFEYAFRAQLRWLKTYWNEGVEDEKGRLPKVDLYDFSSWKKEVKRKDKKGKMTTYYAYRYNGGGRKAWKYGRKVMEIYAMMKGEK